MIANVQSELFFMFLISESEIQPVTLIVIEPEGHRLIGRPSNALPNFAAKILSSVNFVNGLLV
jgi:hypothetical protein